jgi:hypothetical protein
MANMRDTMTEWLGLKTQLKAARADISVLNKREKELRSEVQTYMKTEAADVDVKVDGHKVSYQKKEGKGSITKEVIIAGLSAFFGGNDTQVEGAFQSILDAAPVKERDVLTVRKV